MSESTSGASVPVQDAVYARLAADTALRTWLGATDSDARIYEGIAPPGTALRTENDVPWPYLTLSGGEEASQDLFCARGFDVRLRVRVWVPGSAERLAKYGAGHVRRVLDGAQLVLDGHTTIGCAVERMRTQIDPDGQATQALTELSTYAVVRP